jgi:hypothetical protein
MLSCIEKKWKEKKTRKLSEKLNIKKIGNKIKFHKKSYFIFLSIQKAVNNIKLLSVVPSIFYQIGYFFFFSFFLLENFSNLQVIFSYYFLLHIFLVMLFHPPFFKPRNILMKRRIEYIFLAMWPEIYSSCKFYWKSRLEFFFVGVFR